MIVKFVSVGSYERVAHKTDTDTMDVTDVCKSTDVYLTIII